ncbi:sulfur oxidation c-type cytochrome SoxX [Piscinibacter defluvii]|uniref:sulfur oxidation c-type cytochrome SoxX n=1 Tax=Piscinibacter defluvii TaxID=1796922 RepID=UPI000FDF3B3F|nr:sulfur oxidation c-type cytochrome SoxX [Piscinibacter defluvii]
MRITLLLAVTLVAGCATAPSPQELDRLALTTIQTSFRDQGIAKVDRLKQDLGQAACSSPTPPADDVAKRIEAEALASVKWPAGGQYLGDWREGEKLAQNGRGMTWTDTSAEPGANGGNCYNCHQISKQEISYGTIGPSLYNYGKIRGVKDPADPATAAIVQYTWTKLWNSKAYAACSNMPRFGHAGLLNETQIRHLMALLLDPKSPVNQ